MKIIYQKQISSRSRPQQRCANVFGLIWQAILKRKIMLFSLAVLIVTFPIFYLVFKYQSKTEAAWFDDMFAYRQTVAITNAGTAQTDFQAAITLNTSALVTAGKMQSDCNDIRVTDYLLINSFI